MRHESNSVVAGSEFDFELIVHPPGGSNTVRDGANKSFFIVAVDRPAQGDQAVDGDDLHVLAVHGHALGGDDLPANPGGGVQIGLAVALIEWRQRPVVTVARPGSSVVRLGDCAGGVVGPNAADLVNPCSVAGLREVEALAGPETRAVAQRFLRDVQLKGVAVAIVTECAGWDGA